MKINYELNILFLQDWQHNYNDCSRVQRKQEVVEDFKKAHHDIEKWINPLFTISKIMRAWKEGKESNIHELEKKLQLEYAELIKDNEGHLSFIRSVTYGLSRAMLFYKNNFDVNAPKF